MEKRSLVDQETRDHLGPEVLKLEYELNRKLVNTSNER